MQYVEDSPTIKREQRNAPRFDYIGVLFIAIALGCLEVGVDRGEDYDWLGSNFIRLMFLLSACGFVFGITYLLYVRDPIVNLRVFKDRNLALGSLQIALMGFVLYASAVLIPQFAQQQLDYNATWAGLVLAPGAIVLVMLIPVAGRIINLVPTKYVIAGGGLALGLALIYSMNLVPQLDFWHLVLFRAAQTAALALLFVPISTIAYATVPPELNGDATALFSTSRNVFGGIGISVSTALVTEHLQIRQAHLVHALDPANQPYNVLLQHLETHNVSSAIALARQRGEGPSSGSRLAAAFADFDEDKANGLLEESLALRSVERTIEEVLLEGRGRPRRSGRSTPEYEFGWRYATGWLSALKRLAPPATRTAGVLVLDASSPLDLDALYAQSLELMLRRAGIRTLSLSTAITPNRLVRALPALDPAPSCWPDAASRSTRSGDWSTRCARSRTMR